ncbi:MAG: hypothetical protein A2010_01730 [Nitrospirae bacterium GWD2_57_9]|nr:MAG: hypothetical protein A2010_01730 [Nitrospirae bacterium GWD2_57_9]
MVGRQLRPLNIIILFILSVLVSSLLVGSFLFEELDQAYLNSSVIILTVWSVAVAAAGMAAGSMLQKRRQPELGSGTKQQLRGRTSAAEAGRRDAGSSSLGIAPEAPGSPMKVVTITAEPAGEEEADGDEAADQAEQEAIESGDNTDRIKKIVQGLEELKAAQQLGQALRKQPLDLHQHLAGIVEKTRGGIGQKTIAFELACDGLPKVSADADHLSRILEHLLENAVKAVKGSGTVSVTAAVAAEHLVLSVRDTGRGIKRKDLPHIFERFYRASGSGIGMGLAIVKELVDVCGGTIEVETKAGTGSGFIVRLPL